MQRKEATDLEGLDISSYQTVDNEDLFFYRSPNFNYFRCYGSNHNSIDTNFLGNVQKAKSKGTLSGAYYFGTPKRSRDLIGQAQAQADQFAEALLEAYGDHRAYLTPFLDVEEYKDIDTNTPAYPMASGMTASEFVEWVKAFRDYFFAKTERRLGFYSNRYFLEDPYQMQVPQWKLAELSEMPLWLAEYDQWYKGIRGNVQPNNLGGWNVWTMWQYAVLKDASEYGCLHGTNQIDHNRIKDLSWLMPPKALDFSLVNLGNGSLRIDLTPEFEADYLGANVYVNNKWTAWISKDLINIVLYGLTTFSTLTIKVIAEDEYHDFSEPTIKTITL